jgi:hypothetical protein
MTASQVRARLVRDREMQRELRLAFVPLLAESRRIARETDDPSVQRAISGLLASHRAMLSSFASLEAFEVRWLRAVSSPPRRAAIVRPWAPRRRRARRCASGRDPPDDPHDSVARARGGVA